jgi:hypothetical protein
MAQPSTAACYGGTTDQLVGLGILAIALVMFAYRRLVQDRTPLRLREVTPRLPEELSAEEAFMEGMAPTGTARVEAEPPHAL